jgi:two-component system cell cycle sensor histidine kinase/response regulator CckA
MITPVLVVIAQSVSWGLLGALSFFFWKQHREQKREESQEWTPPFEFAELGAALAGPDGALSFHDAEGCTRFQNTAHAMLFGENAESFDEACQHGRIFKQREAVARLVSASRAGQSWRGEVDVVTAAGRDIALEVHALPMRDSHGHPAGAFWLFHNISNKREQEQQREREERFQRLDSLGQMAGGLAHDFNTYLTVMLGFLSAARANTQLPPEVARRLDQAEHTGWRARELTQEMLDFARGAEPAKCPLHLASVIEESAQLGVQGSTNLRLKVQLAADAWRIEADPRQIRQVVTNLVRNAAQALGEHTGTIEVRLENRGQISGGSAPPMPANYVCLTVSDDGPGIPTDRLPRIFEPFYTTKARGTGLGLAITHNIVKRHGGFVRVKSQPGAGTTFEVFLPALAAETALVETVAA